MIAFSACNPRMRRRRRRGKNRLFIFTFLPPPHFRTRKNRIFVFHAPGTKLLFLSIATSSLLSPASGHVNVCRYILFVATASASTAMEFRCLNFFRFTFPLSLSPTLHIFTREGEREREEREERELEQQGALHGGRKKKENPKCEKKVGVVVGGRAGGRAGIPKLGEKMKFDAQEVFPPLSLSLLRWQRRRRRLLSVA